MTKSKFLTALQKRLARLAVNPSSTRRMLAAGTIDDARRFLAERVKLSDLKHKNAKTFDAKLDGLTRQLQKHMNWDKKKWGAARKFLNLFLRDCTYTWHLRDAYGLARLEPLLELPVDSQVAKKLKAEQEKMKAEPEACAVPRWRGVIHLDAKDNRAYQEIAARVAKHKNMHRVDLDVLYWGIDEDKVRRKKR